MYLVRTITGTARLMSHDEIDMEGQNMGIFKTYPFLTKDQIDKLTYSCIEHITGMV